MPRSLVSRVDWVKLTPDTQEAETARPRYLHRMERLGLVYATHLAFYQEDPRRQEGAEVSFGEVATTGESRHLSYIPASGDLYLGASGGGEVELLARLTEQEAEGLRRDWQNDLSWLRVRLQAPKPGPRRRLSALGAG